MEVINKMASSSVKTSWTNVTRFVLENVFKHLTYENVEAITKSCAYWRYVAVSSDFIWKERLQIEFGVDRHKKIAPGAKSWLSEYERLSQRVPTVKIQVVRFLARITDVSFSADGKLFVVCLDDGILQIYTTTHPVTILHTLNMATLGWVALRIARFNVSGNLLLVTGSYRTNDELPFPMSIVFSVNGTSALKRICTFPNSPLKCSGKWFDDNYIYCGIIRRVSGVRRYNLLLLNGASEREETALIPVYTLNTATIRNRYQISTFLIARMDDHDAAAPALSDSSFYNKLLIYLTATREPRQRLIVFKKFRNMKYFKSLNKNLTIEEALNYREFHPADETYDTEDKVVAVEGQIAEMFLCPNHRYLYVNTKILVRGADPFQAERDHPYEIFQIKFDIRTQERVYPAVKLIGTRSEPNGHFGTTTNMTRNYTASCGVLHPLNISDRHYGVVLEPSLNVDRKVAVDPCGEEMLISAKDKNLTIYRSWNVARNLDLSYLENI